MIVISYSVFNLSINDLTNFCVFGSKPAVISSAKITLILLSPFKIGSFSEEKKPFYDLMIETDPKDYFQYVKHVINYLKIFNKK